MKSLTKYCPECGRTADNPEDNFCPICNVPLATRGASRMPASESPKFDGSKIMGNNGDITQTDNSTHTTTIYKTEVEKSEAERIRENEDLFRTTCRRAYRNGFGKLSDFDRRDLENLKNDLHLDAGRAKAIMEEERENARPIQSDLPTAIKTKLLATEKMISENRHSELRAQFRDLVRCKKECNNEELNYWYYQLCAILEPDKYVLDYEASVSEEYWRIWWSGIAYALLGDASKASDSLTGLASFSPYEYPTQNQSVLGASTSLICGREEDSKLHFGNISKSYSACLEPLCFTLDTLLNGKWESEDFSIPAQCRFYADTLFRAYCSVQDEKIRLAREQQERAKADIAEKERKEIEREYQEAEIRRKEAERIALEQEKQREEARRAAEREERKRLRAERAAKWHRHLVKFAYVAVAVMLLGGLAFSIQRCSDRKNAKAEKIEREREEATRRSQLRWNADIDMQIDLLKAQIERNNANHYRTLTDRKGLEQENEKLQAEIDSLEKQKIIIK